MITKSDGAVGGQSIGASASTSAINPQKQI